MAAQFIGDPTTYKASRPKIFFNWKNAATAEERVKNLDIVVSSMFSMRTAILSTFGKVEFRPRIFFMHCIFSSLIFFGAVYGAY